MVASGFKSLAKIRATLLCGPARGCGVVSSECHGALRTLPLASNVLVGSLQVRLSPQPVPPAGDAPLLRDLQANVRACPGMRKTLRGSERERERVTILLHALTQNNLSVQKKKPGGSQVHTSSQDQGYSLVRTRRFSPALLLSHLCMSRVPCASVS